MVNSEAVNQDFANWLQHELDQRNLNQTQLGRKAGISDAQMSRVMAGLRAPGRKFLEGVAEALGIPVDVVFRQAGWWEPDLNEVLPEAREWSKRLKVLDEATRQATVAAMEGLLTAIENAAQSGRR